VLAHYGLPIGQGQLHTERERPRGGGGGGGGGARGGGGGGVPFLFGLVLYFFGFQTKTIFLNE